MLDDDVLEMWNEVFRLRRIPDEYRDLITQHKVRMNESMDKVREWSKLKPSEPRGKSFFVTGETGRGKTMMGAWLVSSAPIRRNYQDFAEVPFSRWEDRPGAYFVAAHELGKALKDEAFGKKSNLLKWARDCRVLAIDDLGRETFDDTNYVKDGMTNLLIDRFSKDQKTLVTTNLQVKNPELKDRYGTRILNRFQTLGVFLDVNGQELLRGR